jgi:AraC-like DNA-binding protein
MGGAVLCYNSVMRSDCKSSVVDEFHYLPITPRDRAWGIGVTAAGRQCVPRNVAFLPRGHSPSHDYLWQKGRTLHEFAVVYILRGQGELESKSSGRQTVGEGDVLLLLPNVWHRYRPVREIGWDTYWVTFEGDTPEGLRREGVLSPDEPVVRVGLDERILRPFTALLDHIRRQPLGLPALAAADVLTLLAGIQAADRQRQTNDAVQQAVRRAKSAIEASDRPPCVNRLAADSMLSRTHFYQAFKDCTGVSPYQYHLQLRISRAREMLRGSDLPIKQIAAMLGFPSVYQFSRMFKKKTGVAPQRYRKG